MNYLDYRNSLNRDAKFKDSKEIFNASLRNFNKKYSPNPIKYPKAGIERKQLYLSNNVDEAFLSDLQCSICLNLIWTPYECSECGNIFCEYCIKESMKVCSRFCPLCKKKDFTIRPVKTLRKFFNKIRIKCINKNCKEKPEYSDYIGHLEKCDFRLYHCKNEGCKYEDILINMKIHSNECKYRIIKCKYCSKDLKEYMFEKHEKTECTQKINCGACHTSMTRGEFWSNHYSENNDNIICLKAQVKYHEENYNKSQNEIENLKKIQKNEIRKYEEKIEKLKEEKNQIEGENKNLKKELKEWNNSFKDIYNKLILKKEKDYAYEHYNTLDNESKYNTGTFENISYNYSNFSNYQMTPRNISNKNIYFLKKK